MGPKKSKSNQKASNTGGGDDDFDLDAEIAAIKIQDSLAIDKKQKEDEKESAALTGYDEKMGAIVDNNTTPKKSALMREELDTLLTMPNYSAVLPLHMQKLMEARIAFLEKVEKRSDADRMRDPTLKSAPREVLKAMLKFNDIEMHIAVKGISLLVMRVMDEATRTLGLCFSTRNGGGVNTRAGYIPWSNDYGRWPPAYWAWIVALFFKRLGKCLGSVFLQYKLQDKPSENVDLLHHEAGEVYYDIVHGPYFSTEHLDDDVQFTSGMEGSDRDRMNDISLCFDEEKTYKWILELGIKVENRAAHPARAFLVGAHDLVIVDYKGQHYQGHLAYIRSRLHLDKIESSLSKHEIERRIDFICETLTSQVIGETTNDLNILDMWRQHDDFVQVDKKKSIKTLAKTFKLPVADHLATAACAVCGIKEGTASDKAEKGIVSRLLRCPCKDPGALYCGKECQKIRWKTHKGECILQQSTK